MVGQAAEAEDIQEAPQRRTIQVKKVKRGFIQRWFDKMIDSAADQYLGQNRDRDRGLANAVVNEKQYRAQMKSQEFNKIGRAHV